MKAPVAVPRTVFQSTRPTINEEEFGIYLNTLVLGIAWSCCKAATTKRKKVWSRLGGQRVAYIKITLAETVLWELRCPSPLGKGNDRFLKGHLSILDFSGSRRQKQ